MSRTHGLTTLAILHHVTAALALLAMAGKAANPFADNGDFILVMGICAFAFFSVIVRRGWANIDGGSANLSPAKAQWFLFIPFFNFYWVFPALVSLATQTNAKAAAGNLPAGGLTRGFGLVIAILFCVTSLTDLHPSLAWLHLLVYAVYLGFTATYIWQIRRAAAAFDTTSAPPLREPSKMPSVGVAGIIYGSGIAVLLLIALGKFALLSQAGITSRLEAKGYSVRVVEHDGFQGFVGRAVLKEAGVIEIRELRVYSRGNKVGGVYLATGNLVGNAEEIIAMKMSTRAARSGNTILFKAYTNDPDKEDIDVQSWVNSF